MCQNGKPGHNGLPGTNGQKVYFYLNSFSIKYFKYFY